MMIAPELLLNSLLQQNIKFFSGVPDSLLKYFCAYINVNVKPHNHVIAANEGNAVNPFTSLTAPQVYHIPLLLIGWRGEPDVNNEPQHVKQGQVTQRL